MTKSILLFLLLFTSINLFSNTFEENKIYIKFENEAKINPTFSIKEDTNFSKEKVFFSYLVKQFSISSIEKAFKTKNEDLNNTYLIKFSDNSKVDELISLLEKQFFVVYAERIPIYELFYTPNDPQLPQQWNLNTIQAEQAWNSSTGNQNIVVAVTDDAVQTTHQDLSSNIFINTNEIAGNGIDDDNNGYIDDINGWDAANNDNNPNPVNFSNDHGTHVSGIVAATTDNNTGIASIGFNIKILPVKIGNSPSGSLTGAFNGLDYAISCGYTNVINMSWGGGYYSITMQNLFNAAHASNIVLVAAAGNSNTSAPMYPAAYNHVISVGATNSSDQRSFFSNYGSTIDVMAPGSNILSTEVNATNDAYGIKSGTSMASPLVAGLAGLILSNTPNLTPTQVENCLESSSDNIDAQNSSYIGQIGAGRINAFQALECYNIPPISNFNATIVNACINQSIQFNDISIGTGITNWLWNFGDGNTSTLQNPSHSYTTNGVYTVSLTVSNGFGNDIETKTNYININSPSATLSGTSSIPQGGNAFLQVQFTGNAPYSFIYSDGNSSFPIYGITNNPYYFSVSPTSNTTYSLISASSNLCSASINGSAQINIGTSAPPISQDSCNNGQYVINDNGNTEIQSIAHKSNGDYAIAGKTSSAGAGQEDVFVTRFDEQNNILWSKTYGTSSEEIGHPIYIKSTPNGFLIAASSLNYSPGTRVLVIINIDNNGNILWQKRMGTVNTYSNSRTLNIDNQGNYLIAGTKPVNTSSVDDSYIIKLDNLGNTLWTYTYDVNLHNHLFGIVQTQDNGYIATGTTRSNGTGISSKLIIKLDQNGVYQWSKYIDNVNYDNAHDLIIANDGNLYSVGIEGNSGSFDGSLTKFSDNGTLIWSKTFSGANNDYASSLQFDSQENIYVTGYSNSFGSGGNDLFLSKFDNNGNELWTKFYGGSSNENYYGISHNLEIDEANNKIYLFANSNSFGSSAADPYIIITDMNGNSNCNSVDVNWTVNTTNPTVGNAPGVSGTLSPLVNANFTSNNFNFTLDSICTSQCTTPPSNNSTCNNGQYTLDDNGYTETQRILHTIDGGYITAGFTNISGAGAEDIFVIKFDGQNNIEWSKTYGTTSSEKGYTLSLTKTLNGYALCFNSTAYGISPGALTVLNIDLSGNVLWQKKLDLPNTYSHGRYLISDNQDNLIITGNVSDNQDDAYIVKLDNLGNMLWNKKFSRNGPDQIQKVIQTPDNGYIIGANTQETIGNIRSKLLIKFSNSGNLIWSKNYTSGILEQFNDFIISNNNNILCIGRDIINSTNEDIGLTKLDLNGNVLWAKRISAIGIDKGLSIKELSNGSIYISGYSNSFGNGGDDLFISKLDSNGNEIWTNFYGGTSNDNTYPFGANCMDINESEGKIYIVGKTTSFGGVDIDPYILITDLDGNSDCNSVSGTWTQNTITLNSSPVTGTLTNLGTMSNSSLVSNPFITNLDTICSTICNNIVPINCLNNNFDTLVCLNDSVQINLPNGTNYTWNPNYNISSVNTQNPHLFPEVDTTYLVSYLNNDSCFVIDTINISVLNKPNIISTFEDTIVCPGSSVQLNASGAINYIWSPTTGLNNSNIANPIASPANSLSYTVQGTDSNGCSAEDTINIGVLPCCGAFADFTISDSILCVGESIFITNNSVINNPATHSWFFNGATPNTFNGQNPSSISYNTPGIYTIQYLLDDACGIDTISKTVYVFDLPILETAEDTALCDSTTFLYELGGPEVSDYTYSWLPISGLNNPSIANPEATINSSIEYTVTVTDNFTGCITLDTVEIVILTSLDSFILSTDINYCIDDTITLGSSFIFDSIIWFGSINSQNIDIILDNDTSIWSTGYFEDCEINDTIFILADSIPIINLNTNDTSICLGDSVELTATSSFPLIWNSSQTSNSIIVSPSMNNSYIVSTINGNCENSDTAIISVLSLPNINLTGEDTVCINTPVILNANGGTTYDWTNADNINGITNSVTVISDTIIFVTGIGVCSNIDSLNIYAIDSNQVIITGEDSVCEGETITLTANSSTNILWSTGETTNTISPTIISNSLFTVISGSDYCPDAQDDFEVVATSSPSISTISPLNVIQGENVELNVSGGNNYTWTPANNLSCINCSNPIHTANNDMVFYVESEVNGCTASDSVKIIISVLDDCIAMPTAFSPNNDGLNDKLFPIYILDETEISSFRIYNRWGEEVHNDISPWNGKYKNKDQALETYVYFIEYYCNSENKKLIGNVSLIR